MNASVQARPTGWLTLHARGERYRYESADVTTALVPRLQDRGWRASTGATATLGPRWTLTGNYSLEHGPGAAGRFADDAVTYAPDERFLFDVYGGTMARPLELRYYDAASRWIGGRGEWSFGAQRRVWADVALVDDERRRPDASASSFAQVRLRVESHRRSEPAPLPHGEVAPLAIARIHCRPMAHMASGALTRPSPMVRSDVEGFVAPVRVTS